MDHSIFCITLIQAIICKVKDIVLEIILVQLIKKGGLRERANRSRKYTQSENNIKTLDPHRYTTQDQNDSRNDQQSQQQQQQPVNPQQHPDH